MPRLKNRYLFSILELIEMGCGISLETGEAIRTDDRPASMEKDVDAVSNLASEFIRSAKSGIRSSSSPHACLAVILEWVTVGTMALYQISSMMVALDQTPVPPGTKPYLH
jgi:hypothetical protein